MITKETTRPPIGPGERLAVMLRELSETCESIWTVLKSMGFLLPAAFSVVDNFLHGNAIGLKFYEFS